MEDALAKDAQWAKATAEKEDPFLRLDPWRLSEGFLGTWNANQAVQSSSSNHTHADQGGTSQIPRGKWRPDGDKAKTAVGAAADKFHQQQQHMASSSSSWIPTQVFVRGWSNLGDAQGISKTRANEIMQQIKRELEPDGARLIISTIMFDPIQRIAIHVMETPGAAAHVRDKIQQVVSRKNLQQDGKDLQIVIQKPPEIRKINCELNEKHMEIKEFFVKTSDDIRPVWNDHCVKTPGGAVLGRFDGRGAWKWSGQNIAKALKVDEAKVAEFMALQSLDW
jgi:hypothetical protein